MNFSKECSKWRIQDEVLKEVRKALHREIAKVFSPSNKEIDGFENKDIKKIFKSLQEIEELGQSVDVM
jgi:hypothetical protein